MTVFLSATCADSARNREISQLQLGGHLTAQCRRTGNDSARLEATRVTGAVKHFLWAGLVPAPSLDLNRRLWCDANRITLPTPQPVAPSTKDPRDQDVAFMTVVSLVALDRERGHAFGRTPVEGVPSGAIRGWSANRSTRSMMASKIDLRGWRPRRSRTKISSRYRRACAVADQPDHGLVLQLAGFHRKTEHPVETDSSRLISPTEIGRRTSGNPINHRPRHRSYLHHHSVRGRMFWLCWKTLSGSYVVFTSTSRS